MIFKYHKFFFVENLDLNYTLYTQKKISIFQKNLLDSAKFLDEIVCFVMRGKKLQISREDEAGDEIIGLAGEALARNSQYFYH